MSHLRFTPATLGPLTLPNRIVMAPMTRSRATNDHVPAALAEAYYAQRVSAGLIVTEATQVAPEGVGYPNTPGIHNDAQGSAWRRITNGVHAAGGRIFLQMFHVGRISHPSFQPGGALPIAPSAIAAAGQGYTPEGMQTFVAPRALETAEIPGLVAAFAAGARRARDAGFDGVELHGANGYLIDQFLRDGANLRTDAYGGSIENRVRFLLEVLRAVTDAWEPARVGVRQDLAVLVLQQHGRFESPRAVHPRGGRPSADRVGLPARRGRRRGNGERSWRPAHAHPPPTIRRSGDRQRWLRRHRAEAALASGEADLVSLATHFLANPDLPERIRQRRSLNAADRTTFYGGTEKGYTDYPTWDETAVRA